MSTVLFETTAVTPAVPGRVLDYTVTMHVLCRGLTCRNHDEHVHVYIEVDDTGDWWKLIVRAIRGGLQVGDGFSATMPDFLASLVIDNRIHQAAKRLRTTGPCRRPQ